MTAAIKPWAHSLPSSTLLRVPVTRIVEVQSPVSDDTVLLDTGGVDPIASMLYWKGSAGWEPETLPVFLRLVEPGMTVLDIGANTGLFSLLAARRSPTVTVHAIEPVPRVFAMLEANIARNRIDNIHCHRSAVSDSEGTVAMYVPEEAMPVSASLLATWRPDSDRIEVEAQTLDQFVGRLGIRRVDVIKVDTEGTEDAVLAGAGQTLLDHRPFVICEVLSEGNTASGLAEQLAAADYLFFLLAEEGPQATERVVGNAIGGCQNYLFVPRSRLHEAQSLLGLSRSAMGAHLPDAAALSGVYDDWHDALDIDDFGESPWHQLVRSHIGAFEGSDVLEIGCGRGGLAPWLLERAPRVYVAADFSKSAVSAAARRRPGAPATFAVADIEGLPHPDHSFDIVVSCETVEHVSHPTTAVRELARVLRPGGRLFLTTPNYLGTLGLYRGYLRLRGRSYSEEGQPVNNFTFLPRTLSWMRSAGLRPRLVDSRGHYLLLPGRNPIAMPVLDGQKPVLKWLAHHQLIVATKPLDR